MDDLLPAATLLTVLDGLGAIGLDTQALRLQAGLPDALADPDALVPEAFFAALWKAALASAPREELAIEVGLHVPLGAFGIMDYLAASADTVGLAFRSLADQFPRVAPGRSIEIHEKDERYRVVFLCPSTGDVALLGDDFTVAIMVHHFRAHTLELPLIGVELKRGAPPNPMRFAELLGAPVTFGHAAAAIELDARAGKIPMTSRDPLLRRTLESMSSRLAIPPSQPQLEIAIRHRLRNLLPEGRAEAAEVARALGMSERSLHRKLSSIGRSYQQIVDAFRRSEAERLLSKNESGMAEVALTLGFADQSAFSRAFKRWTSITPSQWRNRRELP